MLASDPLTAGRLRSILDRAQEMQRQLTRLQGENAAEHPGYLLALQMVTRYAQEVQRQARLDAGRDPDPAGRSAALRAMLAQVLERQRQADLLFARGGQNRLPHWLVQLVQDELVGLGVNVSETEADAAALQPVLTVGPPGSYRTYVNDLYSDLFQDLDEEDQPADLRHHHLAVLSLPPLEGARARWLPVLLGHELAHLAIHRGDRTLPVDGAGWLTDERVRQAAPDAVPRGVRLMLKRWLTEIACDLNAVRRFGVAGVAALAESLDSVGATELTSPETHPPGVLRISLMIDALPAALTEAQDGVLAPYRARADSGLPQLVPEAALLSAVLEEHRGDLLTLTDGWGSAYDAAGRAELVEWLRDELLQGRPGREAFTGPDGTLSAVTVEDVVNAGWQARLQDTGVPVDDLMAKAVDTLGFLRLWRDASDGEPEPAPPPSAMQDAVGLLSGGSIQRRLEATGDLIVTPLLPGAVQGTGLDVRLSSQFIVFLRTATSAFDPLEPTQDPREMQQLVEKAWGDVFILHPGELVLAATLEYLDMPADLGAQVVTRSSYGRLGLLTATAVQVHPHFKGCLTLELVNLGQMPLTLTPGERIAQLVFQTISPAAAAPEQKYRHPTGPQFSEVKQDRETEVLRNVREARRLQRRVPDPRKAGL